MLPMFVGHLILPLIFFLSLGDGSTAALLSEHPQTAVDSVIGTTTVYVEAPCESCVTWPMATTTTEATTASPSASGTTSAVVQTSVGDPTSTSSPTPPYPNTINWPVISDTLYNGPQALTQDAVAGGKALLMEASGANSSLSMMWMVLAIVLSIVLFDLLAWWCGRRRALSAPIIVPFYDDEGPVRSPILPSGDDDVQHLSRAPSTTNRLDILSSTKLRYEPSPSEPQPPDNLTSFDTSRSTVLSNILSSPHCTGINHERPLTRPEPNVAGMGREERDMQSGEPENSPRICLNETGRTSLQPPWFDGSPLQPPTSKYADPRGATPAWSATSHTQASRQLPVLPPSGAYPVEKPATMNQILTSPPDPLATVRPVALTGTGPVGGRSVPHRAEDGGISLAGGMPGEAELDLQSISGCSDQTLPPAYGTY